MLTSSTNLFYGNNLYDNNPFGNQTSDRNGTNFYTNGTHGNYYNDYTGVDADSDGVGDSPYIFEGGLGIVDKYPLMQPITHVGLPPHGTIMIDGNTDFANQAAAEGWLGDGSLGSPYVIENYFINGAGFTGISISNTDSYFIIDNVRLFGSAPSDGIFLNNVMNGVIRNTIAYNGYRGFFLNATSFVTLENVRSYFSVQTGIHMRYSSQNIIKDSVSSLNGRSGFSLIFDNFDNILDNNFATNNTEGGFVVGINANNNVLSRNYARNNGIGGYYIFQDSHHNTLNDNIAISNIDYGFAVNITSNYNTLSSNYASANGGSAFRVENSNFNFLDKNTANNGGFALFQSNYTTLKNNTSMFSPLSGYYLYASEGNAYRENVAINAGNSGIYLNSANNNLILGNTFDNSATYGINLRGTSGLNRILFNNLYDNNLGGNQAYDINGTNIWANGSYGNYWNDYTGIDADSNGVGDTAYDIDGGVGIVDPYPVMQPITLIFQETHDRLVIDGNADFANQAAAEGWLGDGTPSYPFVISDYFFNGAGESGISILNTDYYFVIQNVVVSGSTNAGGIYLYNVDNGHLINNVVSTSSIGFFLESSNSNTLEGNLANYNIHNGIRLTNSSYNTLKDNRANHNNRSGILFLWDSTYNMLEGNRANYNFWSGFALGFSSSYNTLDNNLAYFNGYSGYTIFETSDYNILTNNIAEYNTLSGFEINRSGSFNLLASNHAANNVESGFRVESSNHNILDLNTAIANGRGGYSIRESSNNSLTTNEAFDNLYSGFFIFQSNNSLLGYNTASGNDRGGIVLYYSNTTKVMSNIATNNNQNGIHLLSSHNNELSGNTNTANGESGFQFNSSNYNTVINNIASDNVLGGFRLDDGSSFNTLTSNEALTNNSFALINSNNNTLIDNNSTDSRLSGFYLRNSESNLLLNNIASFNGASGITLYNSNHNIIMDNIANDNAENGLHIRGSNHNAITDNLVINNVLYGIYLFELSQYNIIYGNNFTGNNQGGIQAFADYIINVWSNGTHGNYWSDYTGVDMDGDFIGDTPYYIDGGAYATDQYPIVTETGYTPPIPTINLVHITSATMDEGAILDLSWTATLPTGYTGYQWLLFQNDSLIDSGVYTNAVAVSIDITALELAPGSYNFTMTFTTVEGISASGTIWVDVNEVQDTTPTDTTPTDTTPTDTTPTDTTPDNSTSTSTSSSSSTSFSEAPGFEVLITLLAFISVAVVVLRRKRI
jgi:parallel beta-helix repeat protein